MKVIFRKPMLDRILDEVQKAEIADQEIEKILLDVSECKRLRRECEPLIRGMSHPHIPNSLGDPGRRIRQGDYVHICGVQIEAAESETPPPIPQGSYGLQR